MSDEQIRQLVLDHLLLARPQLLDVDTQPTLGRPRSRQPISHQVLAILQEPLTLLERPLRILLATELLSRQMRRALAPGLEIHVIPNALEMPPHRSVVLGHPRLRTPSISDEGSVPDAALVVDRRHHQVDVWGGLVVVHRGRQEVLLPVNVCVEIDHGPQRSVHLDPMGLGARRIEEVFRRSRKLRIKLKHQVPDDSSVLADSHLRHLAGLRIPPSAPCARQPAVELLDDLRAVDKVDFGAVDPHHRVVEMGPRGDDALVAVARFDALFPVQVPEFMGNQPCDISSLHPCLAVTDREGHALLPSVPALVLRGVGTG